MRRWIVRFLITWSILGGLFYAFGMPLLMDKVTQKARRDAYASCEPMLVKQRFSPEATARFCHCFSDNLTMSYADLMDVAQKKLPSGLNEQARKQGEACNPMLGNDISSEPPPAAPPQAPSKPVKLKDGSEVFNL